MKIPASRLLPLGAVVAALMLLAVGTTVPSIVPVGEQSATSDSNSATTPLSLRDSAGRRQRRLQGSSTGGGGDSSSAKGDFFFILDLNLSRDLFSDLFVGWNRFFCHFNPFGFRTSCICRLADLASTIANNGKKSICRDTTITVPKEIDITGNSFTIGCAAKKRSLFGLVNTSPGCVLQGGGSNRILAGAPTEATFNSIQFRGGSASTGGAALFAGPNDGSATFNGCDFINNRATSGNGGAISVLGAFNGTTVVTVNDASFVANQASQNGGAMYGTITYFKIGPMSAFSQNTAGGNGGAISILTALVDVDQTGVRFASTNAATGQGPQISIEDNGNATQVQCFRELTKQVTFCGSLGIYEAPPTIPDLVEHDNTNCDTGAYVETNLAAPVCTF
jgi:predicted outer membrane repeat protein